VLGYIFLIVINGLASRGLLGPTNEKLSKKNHTYITPAGWAFSIWGLIFLLQGAGVVYQVLDHGYDSTGTKTRIVEAIGYWWVAGWLAECAWQYFFQWQTRPGMWICMFCLLAGFSSFLVALSNLYRLKEEESPVSPLLYGVYYLPTSINTAWLSVASCIGIAIVTSIYHLPAPKLGVIILAAAGTALSVFCTINQRDTAYGVVLVWALVAVYANQERWPVGVAALCFAAVNGVAVVLSILRRRKALVQGDYLDVQGYSQI
jgi:hypothetical protein